MPIDLVNDERTDAGSGGAVSSAVKLDLSHDKTSGVGGGVGIPSSSGMGGASHSSDQVRAAAFVFVPTVELSLTAGSSESGRFKLDLNENCECSQTCVRVTSLPKPSLPKFNHKTSGTFIH